MISSSSGSLSFLIVLWNWRLRMCSRCRIMQELSIVIQSLIVYISLMIILLKRLHLAMIYLRWLQFRLLDSRLFRMLLLIIVWIHELRILSSLWNVMIKLLVSESFQLAVRFILHHLSIFLLVILLSLVHIVNLSILSNNRWVIQEQMAIRIVYIGEEIRAVGLIFHHNMVLIKKCIIFDVRTIEAFRFIVGDVVIKMILLLHLLFRLLVNLCFP